MNCKPGELCLLKYADSENALPFVGQIHRVGRIHDTFDGKPWWDFDPPLFDRYGMHMVWADEDLRPIRDPGEDAKDETLSWKPVPSTKEPMREILALPVKEM
jgi:hypothetical protein